MKFETTDFIYVSDTLIECSDEVIGVINGYSEHFDNLATFIGNYGHDAVKVAFEWTYKPDFEVYANHKSIFDNPKYYNQMTGSIEWPDDDGFLGGVSVDEVLSQGTLIDRYGLDTGKFTSPINTPMEMRAIDPMARTRPYKVFEVVEPITVKSGEIVPWFDEPGGGIQYKMPKTIEELLDDGVIRRVQ